MSWGCSRLLAGLLSGLLVLAGCTGSSDAAHEHGVPARLGGPAGASSSAPAAASHTHGEPSGLPPSSVGSAATHPSEHEAAAGTVKVNTYVALSEKTLRILDEKGPAAALAALEKAVAKHPAGQGVCHAVAHALGHEALKRFHNNAAKALRYRNDVCGGGYTHGVVEVKLADSKNVSRDILTTCAPNNDGSCWHGVGHGALFFSKFRVQEAEKLCSKAPNQALVARCAEGIYMQLFTLDDGGQPNTKSGYQAPTSRTTARICRGASPDFAGACWFYAPTVILQETGEKWSKAIAWCAALHSGLGRGQCTAGIGSRLVKYHPDDIPYAARQCAKVPGELRGRCLAGMGSYWRVHWHGSKTRASVCQHLSAPRLVGECRRVNA
ncbi:MAG: hypothetical protein ACOYEV_08545 [Candidatus Nanopelagicales bacterium]